MTPRAPWVVVQVDGVFHAVTKAELIDGRGRAHHPMDRDGNTVRVVLVCRPGCNLLVSPRMVMVKYDETRDNTRVDCMTCLVKSARP